MYSGAFPTKPDHPLLNGWLEIDQYGGHERVLRLEQACAKDAKYGLNYLDAPSLQQILECSRVRAFEVLLHEGLREVAAAYMILNFYADSDMDIEILHMAVHPDLRRNGICRAMILAARSMLRSSNHVLGLVPFCKSDASYLFASMGFQEVRRPSVNDLTYSVFRAKGWAIDGTEVIRSLHRGDCHTVRRAGVKCDIGR